MPSRKENTNRNETFGRLLSGAIKSIAAYEGKTEPIIEEELGSQMHLAGKTIQRYKAGHLPPEDRAVEILAEAAIRRGYLGREWLQRFLRAARYPFAEKLLDQLCPIGPVRPHPPRVYENLPAPTYSQFVMREQAFAEVVDGLQQRSAVVLIVGLGGNGKTSLVREVATRCLQDDGAPRFDAVVWVSDKDRPGTTNLSVVLDEIARTLDYPGFTQFAHDEKLYEVGQLLKRQRVLVVVDNFETITDGALLAWLLRLPEPSKALITSREYSRAFRNSTVVADLHGMTDAEAREFVTERLRVLRIEKLVSDPSQLEPMVVATGGNPKALEIALGLVKHGRPLQQVIDDLYAARGELFDDLFTRAWVLLDEAARRVLLVMTFFPASASGEALSATADVQGFAFDRAVERLTDLALLDVQQEDLNSVPRYVLHPLVRVFAKTWLAEQPGFEAGARQRWVGWYLQLASTVAFFWEDLSKLEVVEPENKTAYAVIEWTSTNKQYFQLLQLANGFNHYYYIRGLWDKRQSVDLMAIEAARNLKNIQEEVRALSYRVQILCKQGNIEEAEMMLLRLYELTESTDIFDDTVFSSFLHAVALVALGLNDIDAAQKAWLNSKEHIRGRSIHSRIVDDRWLAICLYKQGRLEEAKRSFRKLLQDATLHGLHLSLIFSKFMLASIDLDQGNLDSATKVLAESSAIAYKYTDRKYIAEIQYTYARLHILRGDLPAARAALAEAIDLFERLGMRRELAEAREALADLDTRELAETAG